MQFQGPKQIGFQDKGTLADYVQFSQKGHNCGNI